MRWHQDELEAVPFHIAYRAYLEPAAKTLRAAATLSDDAAFAKFLRLRADALLSDDYFPSDLAWLELKNPKFDIIFAPYETYMDGLLGVKASYGAAVMIRNERAEQEAGDVSEICSRHSGRAAASGGRSSVEARAADADGSDGLAISCRRLTHGYQAVADNLPNDPRMHEQKGSKKIFFKNFMDARVELRHSAGRGKLMEPEQAAKVSGEGYLLARPCTKSRHGLGPAYARTPREGGYP